jgi:hypothetical protein
METIDEQNDWILSGRIFDGSSLRGLRHGSGRRERSSDAG